MRSARKRPLCKLGIWKLRKSKKRWLKSFINFLLGRYF
ncbi:MAG: hypothetical protein GYB55_01610 [Cytophagales bacterium]|nr:hypothetical protein [Cytophagales bacterium]